MARFVRVHSSVPSIEPCAAGECPCTNCANERRGFGGTFMQVFDEEDHGKFAGDNPYWEYAAQSPPNASAQPPA